MEIEKIVRWKHKAFTTPGSWIRSLKRTVEFSGGCSKQGKGNFTHTNEANLFIACELDAWSGDCLFGAVKLTNNTDPYKYDIVVIVLNLMQSHNFRYSLVNSVALLLLLV